MVSDENVNSNNSGFFSTVPYRYMRAFYRTYKQSFCCRGTKFDSLRPPSGAGDIRLNDRRDWRPSCFITSTGESEVDLRQTGLLKRGKTGQKLNPSPAPQPIRSGV